MNKSTMLVGAMAILKLVLCLELDTKTKRVCSKSPAHSKVWATQNSRLCCWILQLPFLSYMWWASDLLDPTKPEIKKPRTQLAGKVFGFTAPQPEKIPMWSLHPQSPNQCSRQIPYIYIYILPPSCELSKLENTMTKLGNVKCLVRSWTPQLQKSKTRG